MKQNPLGDFKPTSGQHVLEELRGVNETVTPTRQRRLY
jgi:hypothetical protein